MADSAATRRVIETATATFEAYDLEGPLQPELSWLPLSYDRASGEGCYLMRFAPGAVTIAHEHEGVEDFLILEGTLTDSDGTVFHAGDFVSFAVGTRHHSWSEGGCLIAVFEWGKKTEQGA
ncbi:MAG: cupin domain-containing protein [Alphaproteobacteria bacterium]